MESNMNSRHKMKKFIAKYLYHFCLSFFFKKQVLFHEQNQNIGRVDSFKLLKDILETESL